jgi:hypothetical protein
MADSPGLFSSALKLLLPLQEQRSPPYFPLFSALSAFSAVNPLLPLLQKSISPPPPISSNLLYFSPPLRGGDQGEGDHPHLNLPPSRGKKKGEGYDISPSRGRKSNVRWLLEVKKPELSLRL